MGRNPAFRSWFSISVGKFYVCLNRVPWRKAKR